MSSFFLHTGYDAYEMFQVRKNLLPTSGEHIMRIEYKQPAERHHGATTLEQETTETSLLDHLCGTLP